VTKEVALDSRSKQSRINQPLVIIVCDFVSERDPREGYYVADWANLSSRRYHQSQLIDLFVIRSKTYHLPLAAESG
jgi:hypothetical protein